MLNLTLLNILTLSQNVLCVTKPGLRVWKPGLTILYTHMVLFLLWLVSTMEERQRQKLARQQGKQFQVACCLANFCHCLANFLSLTCHLFRCLANFCHCLSSIVLTSHSTVSLLLAWCAIWRVNLADTLSHMSCNKCPTKTGHVM